MEDNVINRLVPRLRKIGIDLVCSFLEKNTPSSQEMQIMQDVGRQAIL